MENELLRRQFNKTGIPEDPENKDRAYLSWFLGASDSSKDYRGERRSKSAILSKSEI